MADETPHHPVQKFQFFEPLASTKGGHIQTNIRGFGFGDFDVTDVKKNLGKFEQLAESFGLNRLKGVILKNTFTLVTQKQIAQDPNRFKGHFPEAPASQDSKLYSIGNSLL